MQRITRAMERFRADPEDAEARVQLSGRRDEIGRAETELDRMQADLRVALNSRARLAALGEAVAKINHDLKNMLTSAQIASERLAALKDPKVSQALPRLERALDRAVKLASGVLAYGKTQEAAPEPRLPLAAAIEAAARRPAWPTRHRLTSGRGGDQVIADPDQLHRSWPTCCVTPARRSSTRRAAAQGHRVDPDRRATRAWLGSPTMGPACPTRARAAVPAFAGFGPAGRHGLGLAIARELPRPTAAT